MPAQDAEVGNLVPAGSTNERLAMRVSNAILRLPSFLVTKNTPTEGCPRCRRGRKRSIPAASSRRRKSA
eukprot:5962512-Pyramimonas_sp.AAC.1